MKRSRQVLLAIIAVVVSVAGATAVLTWNSEGRSTGGLPTGCAKPAGGFLIIASSQGYNDSVGHGSPASPWPVITVILDQQVSIVVCNTDVQAHGFQITHYLDSSIESIAPGQVFRTSFVANQGGDFEIYCSIFCSVHPFMQNGLLRVVS